MGAVGGYHHALIDYLIHHAVFDGGSPAPDVPIKIRDLMRFAQTGEGVFADGRTETVAVLVRGSIVCTEMIKIRLGLFTYSYCPRHR